jgi:threonyl-tRNA synthetase
MKISCNEKELEVECPIKGSDLLQKLNLNEPQQGCALFINELAKDFSETLDSGDRIEILSFDDKRGREVFWHSSAHIMAQAILRHFPGAKPTIGPAIESGFYYDFANLSLSEDDFPKIEEEIQKIVKENYKPEKYTFKNKEEALLRFKDNPYKLELIKDLPEDAPITGYAQGEFFDLCRGPHLPNLGKVKAFKITKTSSAYWRGDQTKDSLTRVYGISFPDRKLLKDYLTFLEEAKKRDHRVLGTKLELFSFFDVAAGMPLIQPNGMYIWNQLLLFWRELHKKARYKEIKTPAMMDRKLWEISGHWDNYRQNMYVSEIDERTYAVKPMNCPACMLYFGSKSHSYRDLPLRIAEIGHVHRHELSGSLTGLLRVRAFHQDDAHIFMKPSDIKSEILGVLKLVDEVYKIFGLTYKIELSTRPEKNTIGSDEDWLLATNGLKEALDEWGMPYRINEGDGAFYGPKIDLHVEDTLKRTWQCGTIQLDMALPQRFDLTYTDSDGQEKRPVMIHRVIYGSIERFLAICIEHFAGKFPLWLNPRAVRILCVADRHVPYAKNVAEEIESRGLPVEIDESNESVSKKVRLAQMDQVSYMLTIGDQECENKTISLRSRDNIVYGEMQVDEFLGKAEKEFKERSLHSAFKL